MNPYENVSDMLVEEVLTDMASTFFGSRVEIDDMLEIFNEFVKELKKKEGEVKSKAGFLNTLLINQDMAAKFYRSIGVSPELFYKKKKYTKKDLPCKKLRALTEKGEFVKHFHWAYAALEETVRRYREGTRESSGNQNESEPNYELVKQMSVIINERIREVNARSAICTLQYTRRFKPETIEREKITGTGFSDYGCDNLDRNLKFNLIDFDSLGLKKFPKLPQAESVKSEISSFGKKVYSNHTPEAKRVLSRIKEEITKKA